MSWKTALHIAAAGGHIQCTKPLVADFVPSAPSGASILSIVSDKGWGGSSSEEPESSVRNKYDQVMCSLI